MSTAKSLHLKLIILTPIFILLSHYLAVYPHEFSHSFMAWFLGYKNNPLDIDYGGTSWLNIFLLSHIDENVDYKAIFAAGHGAYVALIAFAGPGIANGLLFVLSFFLLKNKQVQNRKYLFYFLFWFNLMNLANLYDYVPMRTFTWHGDIAHILQGLNISPWWIYGIFGYLVIFLIWQFFTRTLISAYVYLNLNTTTLRSSLMVACVLIFFGYFSMAGFFDYGVISNFLTGTAYLMIPGFIICAWPTRAWVLRELQKYSKKNV